MSIASVFGSNTSAAVRASNQQTKSGGFSEVLNSVFQEQQKIDQATAAGTISASSSQSIKTGGGLASIDLTADLRQAREKGETISGETTEKLLSTDTQTFIDGVAEATGRTPAQVMSAFLNMNASQATAFCKGLALSTGCSAESFIPMVSKLTGHPEAMMRQYLNGEEEEEGQEGQAGQDVKEGDSMQTARTLNYQRDFLQSLMSPSQLL